MVDIRDIFERGAFVAPLLDIRAAFGSKGGVVAFVAPLLDIRGAFWGGGLVHLWYLLGTKSHLIQKVRELVDILCAF